MGVERRKRTWPGHANILRGKLGNGLQMKLKVEVKDEGKVTGNIMENWMDKLFQWLVSME